MRRILGGLRARMRDILFRRSVDREADEEFRFHIEMETEKNLQVGMPPVEARRRALVAFGGVERYREGLRQGREMPLLEPIWQDLRFGARGLARDPGFSIVAILIVGLGIGATTTVFSAVNSLLLRPLPLPTTEHIASIQEARSGEVNTGYDGPRMPYERYLTYRDATGDVFQSLAAHQLDRSIALRLQGATLAVTGTLTSGNYFQTLGVQPVMGRPYASERAPEIVLSYGLWTSQFGRDPEVLGRTVGLDGRDVAIVGVAPPGFGGATLVESEIWAPVGVGAGDGALGRVGVVPLGRLANGVSLEQGTAIVNAVAMRLPPEEGVTVRGARLAVPSAVPDEARGAVGGFLSMLFGMSALVLLIACANIAGVTVARGLARRRDMAVRLAMGAARTRVIRHLLAESLVLFSIGGMLGIGLAWIGTTWLTGLELPPQVPSTLLRLTPDTRVLAFAIVLTGSTGILVGLWPAVRASRPDLIPALKTGGAASVSGEGTGLRAAFVVGQVALAVALLLTATLFVRSLQMALDVDLGFEPEGVVAATINLGPPLDYDEVEGREFYRQLLESVRALEGVERAGLSRLALVTGSSSSDDVSRPDAPDGPPVNASYTLVSPGYFETMGIEVVEGRAFTRNDDDRAPLVAIINRTLAERLWPGQNPLGHRLEGFSVGPAEIVGVTDQGRYAFVTEPSRSFVFLPFDQVYRPSMVVHARAPGTEAATLRSIAEEVRGLDADVALGTSGPLDELIGVSLVPQRFAAQLVGAFGVFGLVLAGLGLYGALAYQVARRTREFGVRRALGATSARVLAMTLKDGALLAAIGCLAGIGLGAGLAMVLRSFLFGIRPLDPVTFTAVPALLFAVAMMASILPALHAAHLGPAEALRAE